VKRLKLFIFVYFFVGVYLNSIIYAVPASSGNLIISQSGNTLNVRQFGDEYLNWFQSDDDFILGINGSGNWEYMGNVSDNLVFKGIELSGSADLSALQPNDFPSSIFFRQQKANRNDHVLSANTLPSSGTINNLVVMVYFNDHVDSGNAILPDSQFAITPSDTSIYESLFNGETSSLKDYFKDMSQNTVQVQSYLTPWLRLSGNEQNYGLDGSGNTDAGRYQFYEDVILALNSANVQNLPALDGSIQYNAMTIIHSGQNQASIYASTNTNRLWSRWDELSSPSNIQVGGANIQIQKVVTSSALGGAGNDVTDLGVLCHEWSHLFGLPDLYEYGDVKNGIGTWGLMGHGAWGFSGNVDSAAYPMPLSAFSLDYLHWSDTEIRDVSSSNLILKDVESNSEVLKFRADTSYAQEYFLMEYRNFGASAYGNQMGQLAESGALIWHVHLPSFSNDKDLVAHPIVRLIEADDNNSLLSGNALVENGDVWSGNSMLSSFSGNNGARYSHSGNYGVSFEEPDVGRPSYNRLENFRIENNALVFDYTGQRSKISILDLSNGIIKWEPIEGATSYRLERQDNNVGSFDMKVSGNTFTYYDDPEIVGQVDYRYRVIENRYIGLSEYYSDAFFYGFIVDRVDFDPNAQQLEITFNEEVDLSSINALDLSKMRVLNSVGDTLFSLEGTDASAYSFPGLTGSNHDASFTPSMAQTATVVITLSTAQLYEFITNSNSTNSDLLFEIDAGAAQLNNVNPLSNTAQLFSQNLAVSIDGIADGSIPDLESARYDDNTGTLMLIYDEPIYFDNLNFPTNLNLASVIGTTVLDGATYSIADNVLSIVLDLVTKSRFTNINNFSANVTTLTINTNEVKNFSNLGSVHSTSSIQVIKDVQAPFLTSFMLNNHDEDRTLDLSFSEAIFFKHGVPANSAAFQAVIIDSSGADLVNISGNGFELTQVTDTSLSNDIIRVEGVTIHLLASEVEAIDQAYGFVNPAPAAYLKIEGQVFSDYQSYLDDLSYQVDTTKKVTSNDYTPKRRARFIHPHYDDLVTANNVDEGLIWKSTHLVKWEINGGWENSDSLRLIWSNGNISDNIALNFNLSNTNGMLQTTQFKTWNTTTVVDALGYQFHLLRESDLKVYQSSMNTVEVDNTAPTVYLSYLSESNPTNKVNAVRVVNQNLHSFDLNSQELLANLIIVANYDEPVIASPNIFINQQGSADTTAVMSPAEGTLPANVFYYAYKINEQDNGNYIDGIAQVSISEERDRARGHLLVNVNPQANEILGTLSQEVDSSTVFFSIDTVAPIIDSAELIIADESIIAEFSILKLKFRESLYNSPGDELITRVLESSNYFIEGEGVVGINVVGVSVDDQGFYTLTLNGIIRTGDLFLTVQNNIVDFHNNPYSSEPYKISFPGPLIRKHELVLSPRGRTRLLLSGGYLPYTQEIASIYSSVAELDPMDGKTIYGRNLGDFFVDVTENRNQVRVIKAEVTESRINSITADLSAYRDELDFQMISFPFNLETWDGQALIELLKDPFGSYGEDYILFHYNELGAYESLTGQTTEVGPGYGFWMASRKKIQKTFAAEGPLLEQVVAIDLHKGWNLIGNPFDVDLNVNQIYVSTEATRYNVSDLIQSETAHKIWHIDLVTPQYQSLQTLSPFMGAWLYIENSVGAEVMMFRTPENSELEIYFPSESKPEVKSREATEETSEPYPPSRPKAFGGGESADSGGGGGCLLRTELR